MRCLSFHMLLWWRTCWSHCIITCRHKYFCYIWTHLINFTLFRLNKGFHFGLMVMLPLMLQNLLSVQVLGLHSLENRGSGHSAVMCGGKRWTSTSYLWWRWSLQISLHFVMRQGKWWRILWRGLLKDSLHHPPLRLKPSLRRPSDVVHSSKKAVLQLTHEWSMPSVH